MKRTFFALVMLLITAVCHAQGFLGGFFSQSQTQLQYYLQQISATQAFAGDLQKGYNIVKTGTGNIGNIKNNDLTLHQNHFDSLKIVSAKVRNYSKIKAITSLQQQIIGNHSQIYPQLNGSGQFTAAELNNYQQDYNTLLQAGNKDLEELQLVITDGKLQMTDDERIAAIDKIYTDIQSKYAAFERLNTDCLAVAAQRARDGKDAGMLRSLQVVQ